MFGTKFRGTLFATLACAGFCWGEQLVPVPVEGTGTERVLTFQEPGKEGQKCRVLSETIQEDGMTALELENIQSGEHMTILEVTPKMSLVPLPQEAPPVSATPTQTSEKKVLGSSGQDRVQTGPPGATPASSTEPRQRGIGKFLPHLFGSSSKPTSEKPAPAGQITLTGGKDH